MQQMKILTPPPTPPLQGRGAAALDAGNDFQTDFQPHSTKNLQPNPLKAVAGDWGIYNNSIKNCPRDCRSKTVPVIASILCSLKSVAQLFILDFKGDLCRFSIHFIEISVFWLGSLQKNDYLCGRIAE
jgi:hypothetical protein